MLGWNRIDQRRCPIARGNALWVNGGISDTHNQSIKQIEVTNEIQIGSPKKQKRALAFPAQVYLAVGLKGRQSKKL